MGFDSKLVTLYFLGASSVVAPDVAVFKMLISHAGVYLFFLLELGVILNSIWLILMKIFSSSVGERRQEEIQSVALPPFGSRQKGRRAYSGLIAYKAPTLSN